MIRKILIYVMNHIYNRFIYLLIETCEGKGLINLIITNQEIIQEI